MSRICEFNSELNLRFPRVFTMSLNLLIAAAVVFATASANANPSNQLRCYNISVPTFYSEFYNTTSLNTADQEHAPTFLSHFQPILRSNCSPFSRILICASYLPFCFHPSTIVALPCRHLCSIVQSSCIHLFHMYGVLWPSHLNCSHLPASPQLCLSPQSPSPSSTPTLKKFTSPRKTSSSSTQSSTPSTFTNVTASTTHSPSSPSHRVILVSSLTVVWFLLFSLLILIYHRHCISPQIPPPAPNEDSVHYSVHTSSVNLSSHLPPPTTQPPPPPPPPLPAKNKDMQIYQNTNSTTLYAVSDLF